MKDFLKFASIDEWDEDVEIHMTHKKGEKGGHQIINGNTVGILSAFYNLCSTLIKQAGIDKTTLMLILELIDTDKHEED